MNRRDFVALVANTLREHGYRKSVPSPKQVFTISDSEGNSKSFVVKARDRHYQYNKDDVDKIIDGCIAALHELLRNGDNIGISGIGNLGLTYKKPRVIKSIHDGSDVIVPGKYVPKFRASNELNGCAIAYTNAQNGTYSLDVPEERYDDTLDDVEGDD